MQLHRQQSLNSHLFTNAPPPSRLNPGDFAPRGEYCWRGIDGRTGGPSHHGALAADAPTTPDGATALFIVEDRRPSTLEKGLEGAKLAAAATAAALSRTSSTAARAPCVVARAVSDAAAEAALSRVSSGGGGARARGGRVGSSSGGGQPKGFDSGGGGGAVAGVALSPAASGALSRAPTVTTEVVILEEEDIGYPVAWRFADVFATAALAAFSALAVFWVVTQRSEEQDTPWVKMSYGVALLVGPAGCFFRFYLSRFNGRLAGRWAWFPLGTFTANMVACVVNYSIRAGVDRSTVLPPFVVQAVLTGIMTGFSGSLSTVSTWVVEVSRCWGALGGLLAWSVRLFCCCFVT